MENCYLVDTLMVAGVTEFMVPFDGQAIVKDTELYKLKIGSLIYLII